MFGIGASELMIIGVVLLIVVGPTRLPKLLKAVVSSYREFRRATRELRASTGIDEILQDEDLQELRKPLNIPGLGKPFDDAKSAVAGKSAAANKRSLSFTERVQENPPEGVDLAEIRDEENRPSEEEREAIRNAKQAKFQKDQAIKDAKLAAAEGGAQGSGGGQGSGDEQSDDEVSPEDQVIIDAKLAAAGEASESESAKPVEAASAES